MSLNDMILASITNLVRVYINWRFIKIFFPVSRVKKRTEFAGYAFFYIITISLFLLFHIPIINLISNIVCLFCVALLYEGSSKKRIVISVLIYSVNMFCDFCSFLLMNYEMETASSQVFSVVTVLLILICELIAEKILGEQARQEYIKGLEIIVVIPTIGILMLHFLVTADLENRNLMIAESIGVLIVNIVIFYLYHTMSDIHQKLYEKEILEQQVKIYANQLEVIDQSQIKIHALRHDMLHHIKELQRLTDQNRNMEIMQYLDKMETAMINEKEYIYSGNKEVDGILNYMLEKADRVLKRVDVQIKNLKSLDKYSFELTVVLGNLLENAIEAAWKTEEQFLKFSMEEDKGVLYIKIVNQYNGVIRKKGDKIFSTKKDKNKHGLGLRNVKEIVDKNYGVLDIKYDDKTFEVFVVLYLD